VDGHIHQETSTNAWFNYEKSALQFTGNLWKSNHMFIRFAVPSPIKITTGNIYLEKITQGFATNLIIILVF
jgi:hypothetical protein